MIGNEVSVTLCAPTEIVNGTLNRQGIEGIWIIVHGMPEQNPGQRFFPQHRIVEIEDRGYRPR
jgi:hypothetical protein